MKWIVTTYSLYRWMMSHQILLKPSYSLLPIVRTCHQISTWVCHNKIHEDWKCAHGLPFCRLRCTYLQVLAVSDWQLQQSDSLMMMSGECKTQITTPNWNNTHESII